MLKIFLISVGFCIFIPLQVEACALAFFDSLSVPVKKALREAGIRTIEDLRKFSRRELTIVLPGGESMRQITAKKIEAYLSDKGESLARDFLVEDVGLSVRAANELNRAGVRTEEDLLKWTERDLLALWGVSRVATGKIEFYLSHRGESVTRDFLIKDVGLRIETVRALRAAGVHTAEDLRQLSEQELRNILPKVVGGKTGAIKKIKIYLSHRGEFLAPGLVIEDIGLRPHYVKALKEAGIRTIEDLRKFSRRELTIILPGGEAIRDITAKKIEVYFSDRGESLARDFLVEDVGLSVRAANELNRAGVRTEEDLLKWTERDLLALWGVSRVATGKIESYLSHRGKSLAKDMAIKDVELSLENR